MTQWSPEDKARALSMRADKVKFRQIAEALGRTTNQVCAMVHGHQDRQKNEPGTTSITVSLGYADKARLEGIPEYVIAEAIARAHAPRSTTMRILGDPVLNQCALWTNSNGRRICLNDQLKLQSRRFLETLTALR